MHQKAVGNQIWVRALDVYMLHFKFLQYKVIGKVKIVLFVGIIVFHIIHILFVKLLFIAEVCVTREIFKSSLL